MNTPSDTWNSEHYKKYSGFQNHEWALDSLENLHFKGNETILDIGCGDGTITAKIAQKIPNGKVVGVDLSQSMIKAAKESYAQVANLSFELADATNFFFEQKFDYVTSFFVLHWIEDQLAVLKNIKKVIKPNGKIIIIMSEAQENSPLIMKAFEHLEREGRWKRAVKLANKRHFPQSANRFKQLLAKANFKHLTIETIYRTSTSKTLETTVQSLMRWIPHSTELPYDQALQFSKALAEDMYKQLKKRQDEPIIFQQAFLVIEAQ